MGEVERLLYGKPLASNAPAHYAGKATTEICESIHFHRRNVRLELTKEEYGQVLGDMQAATRWKGDVSPAPGKPTQYVTLTNIDSSPGVTPDRFEIEHSKYPTIPGGTIHIHYRDLRIEFSLEEWDEFATGIIHAWHRWVQKK